MAVFLLPDILIAELRLIRVVRLGLFHFIFTLVLLADYPSEEKSGHGICYVPAGHESTG